MNDEATALAIREHIAEVDRMDDDQIIAIMGGDLVTEYVYSFKDGSGRKQEGLSWAGIREMAQLRGNIRLGKPDIEDHPDYIRAMVEATDLKSNVTVWGGCHQPKMVKPKEGEPYPDDFAYEKAISKAQRNAIKNLMPMGAVKAIISQLKGGGGNGQRPHGQQQGHVADLSLDREFKSKGDLLTAANADMGISRETALEVWKIESVVDVPTDGKSLNELWRTLVDWDERTQ